MTIEITHAVDEHTVEFATSFGKGIGILKSKWKMEEPRPYVELDIDAPLEVGRNVTIVPQSAAFIRHVDKKNEILGVVEDMEEDGLIFLRLSSDCLIMLDVISSEALIKPGDHLLLTVEAGDLTLT